MSLNSLYKREIVKSARIVRRKLERLLKAAARDSVALPLEVGNRNVGIGIGIVRAQADNLFKRTRTLGVLLRVEQANAVIIPSHPLRIVRGIRWHFRIGPQRQCSRAGGHLYHRHLVVFCQTKVDVVLIEAAIVHLGCHGEWTHRVLGYGELIANNLRAARDNGVVVGNDSRVPDLMKIDQLPVCAVGSSAPPEPMPPECISVCPAASLHSNSTQLS